MENEKLKDAVFGFAVGDALGVPFEFKTRNTFKCKGMVGFGTWNQPPGTWSDDTSMVLATCESIKRRGKIDAEDIMWNFCSWYYDGKFTPYGKMFDIGNTTKQAIRNFFLSNSVDCCGLTGNMNNGNGALMRILPLAFAPNVTYGELDAVVSLTHDTQLNIDYCERYVTYCCDVMYGSWKNAVIDILKKTPRSCIKSTGYVVDTLNAALWCFANTNNYKDCVLTAVNLGGDTDTIAALAGGLAGIKYGIEAIPSEWIKQLANKELIEDCLF